MRGGRTLSLALVILFMALPLIVVAGVSLNEPRQLLFPPRGLSLRWYGELFTASDWRGALTNSLIVAVTSAALAVAERVCRRRDQVLRGELRWRAGDLYESEAQLLFHERFKPFAVAVSGVERVIVGPRHRPVVAALGAAEDGVGGRPFNARDDGAGRIRRRAGGGS